MRLWDSGNRRPVRLAGMIFSREYPRHRVRGSGHYVEVECAHLQEFDAPSLPGPPFSSPSPPLRGWRG
jgi:hypothetical protein